MRCRWCGHEIEENDGVWWVKGTCSSVCEVRPYDAEGDTHEPGMDVPPSLERPALERWLNA